MKNCNVIYFLTLKNSKVSERQSVKYANKIMDLLEEFWKRFSDIQIYSEAIEIFPSPFSINVSRAPEEFQMELVDL
jgi:hypothetical protein